MARFFGLLCSLLLPTVVAFSDDGSRELFFKAEELFAAALYPESIPFYQAIDDPSLHSSAVLRIGEALFYEGFDEEALLILKSLNKEALAQEQDEERFFFIALCQGRLGLYDDAIETLSSRPFEKYRDAAHYEQGVAYFFLGKPQKARSQFAQLNTAWDHPELYSLSRFYLARLALGDGDVEEASRILKSIPPPEKRSLQKECAYLKGEAAFYQRDYHVAAAYFEEALPDRGMSAPWEHETRYRLGWCYLKNAEETFGEQEKQRLLLSKASDIFRQLVLDLGGDREVIALAYSYLMKGNLSGDLANYVQAEEILSAFHDYTHDDAKVYALLIYAESGRNYAEREAYYRRLTHPDNAGAPFYVKGWYYRALNDYEEAAKGGSVSLYAKASESLRMAYHLLRKEQDEQAVQCLKLLVESLWAQGSMGCRLDAFGLLQAAVEETPERSEWDEIYGAYAVRLIGENVSDETLKKAEATLRQRGIVKRSPASLQALAAFYFNAGKYEESYKQYLTLAEAFPVSALVPQALLQASFAADRLEGYGESARLLRKKIYEEYQGSEVAAQAYLLSYTYQDYLQGDRFAIKHLSSFSTKFPNSPLVINVNYLLGLDLKRDRKTPEGKWVRKKSPVQSIQAFSEAEAAFDRLWEEGKIPSQDKEYYITLRYRASLEKGLVHYEVAAGSSAAKKDIYLQYAIDAFRLLQKELEAPSLPEAAALFSNAGFSSLHEECLYWLAQSYLRAGDSSAARTVIDVMLKQYQEASVNSGYYLARVHCELGALALSESDYAKALDHFNLAEAASKGVYLGVDEKLELWIAQSRCYQAQRRIEAAMLVLSKVINDDSISHLRLKAMFMRAELYEKLGRPELARRQLESVAKMGGTWAEQAKLKLESDYANQ